MLFVKDLMTRDVFSLKKDDNLAAARDLMKLVRIRHIPIVDDDSNFIGLITHRDILSATISKLAEVEPEVQEKLDVSIPIQKIMRTDVITITPEATLKEAASILLEHKYGCLPVVEGNKLVGILTEADFLRLVIRLMELLDIKDE
jgi:CBS domain-containing membrane protein